jgi:DNA polymerase-1
MPVEILREPLGVIEGKEYWYNVTRGSIEWRVPDIRESVHAEPGFKVLSCDYSQIEVRLMAFLSGDPGLTAALNKGGDIHCYTAVDCFGQEYNFDYDYINKARKDDKHPRHDLMKSLRSQTKTVTFGVPYGAGPPRVASMTNLTIDEAQALIARFFAKYPTLKFWLDKQGREAIQFGFTTSPRGRKRFYVQPAQDDPERDEVLSQIRRWAGNHPIQAGNVDMLKPAMRRIYDAFRARGWTWEDARLLFVVHDEIVATAREELVLEARMIIHEAMKWAYDRIISNIISGFEDKLGQNGEVLRPGYEAVLVDDIWVKD